MKGYGAVELGVHRFHPPGHEGSEALREGKSIDLWRFKEGAWKITRVLGYHHRAQVASGVGNGFAAVASAIECII